MITTGLTIAVVLFIIINIGRRYYVGIEVPGITKPLSPQDKLILIEHFDYYQKLPETARLVFESRVAHFMATKKYVPRNMDSVSKEMRVLIAATAIQLTFGLENVSLKYFRYIVIYPDKFLSADSQRYHLGEVNPKYGAIVLSWRNFVTSLNRKDGRNLGLHEMAHALRLENKIINGEAHFFDTQILNQWEKAAAKETLQMQFEKAFFRNYASTNKEEFFAVAVENFFEKPKAFKEYNEELYTLLCMLLKQDPLNLEALD